MPVVGRIYLYAHLPDRPLRQVGDAFVLVSVAVPLIVDAPEPVGKFKANTSERSVGALLLKADRF